MSDTLREMVTREMRAAVDASEARPGELALTASAHPAFDAAVEVALRLLGKWGHVACCACTVGWLNGVLVQRGARDPRCAQPGGEETR